MPNIVNDLVAGIVTTIEMNSGYFAILGVYATGSLKVEYAREGQEAFIRGSSGTCQVYPEDVLQDSTNVYEDTAISAFVFKLNFDVLEIKGGLRAKAVVQHGLLSIFGDGGDEFFANFTDSGSNVLGKSGQVEISSVTEGSGQRGPANVFLEALLTITLCHQVPLSADGTDD